MRILLLLIMVAVMLAVSWKWRQSQETSTTNNTTCTTMKKEKVEPKNENEHYITVEKEPEPEPVQMVGNSFNWLQAYTQSMMDKFKIDHAHREIFKTLHENITRGQMSDECELLYLIVSQCKTLSVVKKMEIGVYIIWKSTNQQHIDHVYEIILSIADDKHENSKIRANALEILMRSNNRVYMDRSRRIMDTLKEHEKIQEMEQVRQRMERIQNVLQQRAQVNPSTLRRVQQTPQQELRTHIPLSPEEVQVQHVLLDQYRRLERRAFNAMKHKSTVYDDSQNVHNHKINESVVKSAQNIINSNVPAPLIHVEKELEKYYPGYEKNHKKLMDSLNRVRTDPSTFRGKTTIAQVFNKVVSIIANSRHKEEMWKRLGEELVDMNQLCATGHLSRLVNVLQGFEDVPQEFKIQMDPKDEIYANLSNYITMQVQNSGESEKLLESMIDPEDRSLFVEFVCIVLKPKVAEIHKEYENMVEPERLKECIHWSIKNYIKSEKETDIILKNIL